MTSKEQPKFDQEAFETWLSTHPGGKYSQFSAAKVAYSIRKGRPHPTLGPRLQREGDWWDAGKPIFNEILDFYPIAETAKVCDYGCGSLRISGHFIKRQPRDCFFGLDVTEDFIAYGRELIGPELIKEKRPQLGAISKKIDEAVAYNADVLYSTHVAIHVHPDEKRGYIDNIKRIAHRPGATIVFDALIAKQPVRFRNSGWGWPIGFYLEAMEPLRLIGIAYRREREDVGQEYFLAFQR
jgi:SAM-dependent methyltransferase